MRSCSSNNHSTATSPWRKTRPPGSPSLTFVVPVDVGEDTDGDLELDLGEDENGNDGLDLTDGDFTGPNGSIQWGVVEEEGPRLDTPAAPHQAVLRFIAAADVAESAVSFDINGDGDLSDIFQRGSIRLTTTGGRLAEFGRGMILLGKDDPSDDVNGDSAPDPLFSIEGETFTDSDGNGVYSPGESFVDTNGNGAWEGRLRFNLWVFKATGNQRPLRRNFSMAWEVQLDTD